MAEFVIRGQAPARAGWRGPVFGLAGLVCGVLLAWYGLLRVEWAAVGAALSNIDWRLLPMALGALGFAWFLEACRWKLLLSRERVSIFRLFLVRHVGSGLNTVSPIRLVAEATQTIILSQSNRVGAAQVISSIAIARLLDLLVTMSLVGVGLIVLPQLSGFRPVVVPLWGLMLAAVAAFLLFGRHIQRLPAARRLRLVGELLGSVGAIRSRPWVLLWCVGLTSVAWMSVGLGAWLVARAAGIDLPFWLVSILIVATMLFTSAIPAPPGVVGVYEFVAVSTLGLFAVDPTAAVSFALVMHALLLVPPLVIAVPVLVVERRSFLAVAARVRRMAWPARA